MSLKLWGSASTSDASVPSAAEPRRVLGEVTQDVQKLLPSK